MFEPIRGGTRGGQAEFKWSDVSADKDRENYLGHSINAPTGRWQKNKDVHWYSRDSAGTEAERAEEIRKIKELEAEAMSVALGFGPSQKGTTSTTPGPATGANATAPKPDADAEATGASKAAEKEDKQRRKAKRKEEKQARKEQRRAARAIQREQSLDYARRDRRPRDPSRSRSPPRRRTYNDDDHRHPPLRRYSRSRSPLPSRSGYRDDRYDHGRTDHQRRS